MAKRWVTVPAESLQARIVAFVEEHRLGGPEMFHVEANGLTIRLVADRETGRQGPLADFYFGARPSEREAFERVVSRAGYRVSYWPDRLVLAAA